MNKEKELIIENCKFWLWLFGGWLFMKDYIK
jgi:hypothetical protein